jgi:hypothetical protein
MKFLIWFNRGARPEEAWVILDPTGSERRAAEVTVVGQATFVLGPEGSCPQGWAEVEGAVIF